MPDNYINYEARDRVAIITLDRPDKRNALNEEMITELKDRFLRAKEDPNVKVILLKANGKAFSAGADLEYLQRLQQNSYEENHTDSRHLMDLFWQIYTHPKFVISQVEGHAIAGGCGLATICDLCYAVPGAQFGYTEVQIGFIPALVSIFLSRKIGEGRARELLLTARLISAAEAAGYGLITRVEEKEKINDFVWQKAQELCHNTSSQSIAQTKQLLADTFGLPIGKALAVAAERNAYARGTEDCQKGIKAFLDKQKPSW
ncbi:MAG: enoyl-CoA hydratase/isomerase family protein [Chitinophagaceae bacterium]|nr:MAG: enoyl-CoA hydratase/isomerase family protein [Chitinophagaceae bacterium]